MDVRQYKDEISKLALKYGLGFVALFGSQATGRTHPKSDVDIAVISRKSVDRIALMTAFEDIFKREDVEVVNLAHVSPTLMREVVEGGKLLYEKEEGDFLKWKIYAVKVWMETEWLRKLRDRRLIEWANAQG